MRLERRPAPRVRDAVGQERRAAGQAPFERRHRRDARGRRRRRCAGPAGDEPGEVAHGAALARPRQQHGGGVERGVDIPSSRGGRWRGRRRRRRPRPPAGSPIRTSSSGAEEERDGVVRASRWPASRTSQRAATTRVDRGVVRHDEAAGPLRASPPSRGRRRRPAGSRRGRPARRRAGGEARTRTVARCPIGSTIEPAGRSMPWIGTSVGGRAVTRSGRVKAQAIGSGESLVTSTTVQSGTDHTRWTASPPGTRSRVSNTAAPCRRCWRTAVSAAGLCQRSSAATCHASGGEPSHGTTSPHAVTSARHVPPAPVTPVDTVADATAARTRSPGRRHADRAERRRRYREPGGRRRARAGQAVRRGQGPTRRRARRRAAGDAGALAGRPGRSPPPVPRRRSWRATTTTWRRGPTPPARPSCGVPASASTAPSTAAAPRSPGRASSTSSSPTATCHSPTASPTSPRPAPSRSCPTAIATAPT